MTVTPDRIALSTGELKLVVTRRDRARRFILRLDDTGETVSLTVPGRASHAEALHFLNSNRGWIERRVEALPPRMEFADGVEIPLLGVPHAIRHRPEARGKGAAWIEDGALHVGGEARHLPRRVTDFLRETARHEFGSRARRMAERVGRKLGRITIRDTSSRWGSCSAKGDLAFSWRLILAPADVVDYVVAHEVAHLKHMNHGARFWALVETLVPGSERPKLWLRRNRLFLRRFG